MAKVLDNGDVSSQAPVHTAALVTNQHTSADRCPARVWGSRGGKSVGGRGKAPPPEHPRGRHILSASGTFTQSPQEPGGWPLALSYNSI